MNPGQKLRTRNDKYGSWKRGEQGIYKGPHAGQYIVDFHGRLVKYSSEEWVLKEWEEDPYQSDTYSYQFTFTPGEPTMTGPQTWRKNDHLRYLGPENQQLVFGDKGIYEGIYNQMHMVRVVRTGFVASYPVNEDYYGRGIATVWEQSPLFDLPDPYGPNYYPRNDQWTSYPLSLERLFGEPGYPPLNLGQRLKVRPGINFFDHLESKLGTYTGLSKSTAGEDCLTIELDGGGIVRYPDAEQLWKEWGTTNEKKPEPKPPPKPQSSETKRLCSFKSGVAVTRLSLAEYLAVETDPVRRDQAYRFSTMLGEDDSLAFELASGGFFRMCSTAVNDQVDQVDINRCMDECNCDPVTAHPFCKLTDGTKVFSDPCTFIIGAGNKNGFGYEYFSTSREEMAAKGIPKLIQDRCETYVRSHADPHDKKALDSFYKTVVPKPSLAGEKDLKADAENFLKLMQYGEKK